MKNVTITLDEEVARWARVRAAERDMSVSRLVGEMLREHMRQERGYEAAMEQYFARLPGALSDAADGYPCRDDLHDRVGLR